MSEKRKWHRRSAIEKACDAYHVRRGVAALNEDSTPSLPVEEEYLRRDTSAKSSGSAESDKRRGQKRGRREEEAMLELVGAIDQGTQSTRFILYDKTGAVVTKHQEDIKSIYPQPGWCEQDPMELWSSTQTCMRLALEKATEKDASVVVKGIGLTNQRETTIAWDRKTGKPLHNAIVWHDLRTTDIVKRYIEKGSRDDFRECTGLPISTYFSAVKIRWLIENVPAVAKALEVRRIEKFFSNYCVEYQSDRVMNRTD